MILSPVRLRGATSSLGWPMADLHRLAPGPVRVQSHFVDGAPLVVCRPWREGDERRGMRGAKCIMDRCPHTLAVSEGYWHLGWMYMCQDDAAGYGLPVGVVDEPTPRPWERP